MLKIISNLLRNIADKIDSGNSNLTEDETIKVIETLKSYTDKEIRLSKYLSCLYLNMSRASFDNYVRLGKLPKGKKLAGFKELSWGKKELDLFIKDNKDETIVKKNLLRDLLYYR